MNSKRRPMSGADVRALNIGDFEVGMAAYYTTSIGRDEVAAFAELSGDLSPLHVDEPFGERSRFGGNLVHGVLVASHFSTLVGVFLPGRNALLSDLRVEFLRPIYVGSEIVVSASIVSVQPGSRMIQLRLLAFVSEEVHAAGEAKVKVQYPVNSNNARTADDAL